MEIKIYADSRGARREKKAFAAYSTLLRTKALCQDVRKIVINLTPVDSDVEFSRGGVVDKQISRLGELLKSYERLKEVTLTIDTGLLVMDIESWEALGGNFFELANKRRGSGVSLCVELVDYEIHESDSDYSDEEAEEIVEEREFAEKMCDKMIEKYCGKGADVSIYLA